MAPSLVQSNTGILGGTSTYPNTGTVSFENPVTGGNTVIVLATPTAQELNPLISGCTLGGEADNFAALANFGNGDTHTWPWAWADPDCAGGAADVEVTADEGLGGEALLVWITEWSGLDTGSLLDTSVGAASSSNGTDWDSGPAATSAASEVWLGVVAGHNSGAATTSTPDSPWTSLGSLSSFGDGADWTNGAAAYQIVDSTGTMEYTGTITAPSSWVALAVAVKGSSSPSYSGTGDAAVSLAASASGSSARAGGGSAAVALGASASGASARAGSGSAVLSLRALATGSSHRSGTGIAALSLSALATTPAPAQVASTGSWWGLVSTLKQSRQEFDAYWSAPPVACPVCGEPLKNAPSTKSGSGVELYCNYAGDHEFLYPRDHHVPVRLDSGSRVSPL